MIPALLAQDVALSLREFIVTGFELSSLVKPTLGSRRILRFVGAQGF